MIKGQNGTIIYATYEVNFCGRNPVWVVWQLESQDKIDQLYWYLQRNDLIFQSHLFCTLSCLKDEIGVWMV